jgi:Cu/Ag efflux protein CusF
MRLSIGVIAFSTIVGVIAGCSSKNEETLAPAAPAAITTEAASAGSSASGEAGGTLEETFTATATVSAIDPAARRITLESQNGNAVSFTAGPQIRNFDQIKAGDKVTATVTERLVVFVRSGGTPPSASHAAALATAPKGAKPGALAAEAYELTATVQSIDPNSRTATLKFADGQTRTVAVRPDVDLSRYKVDDTVVIRITAALAVLVESP